VIDPITVGVISSAIRATALEMSEALRRSAHSPIIREMLDYSCAVFTAGGETVAQDDLIPAFLGTMATTMPWVLEAASGRPLVDGDVFFTNDPYRGGTHTPDIQLFAPVIDGGRCVAWCGNIAHHSDVGGVNPGTEGYANRSIFEEGLRIPPLPLARAGELNEPLLALIANNIRDPDSTAGDLRAQLAALKLGVRRMDDLIARHGAASVVDAMTESLDQAERRIRAAIGRRDDGVAGAEGWLDDDGLGSEPVRLAARVEVAGETVRVDLSGTDDQLGGGLNLSVAAARAAVFYAVKAVFDPDAPHNGGPFRAIDVLLPEGSLANPRFPAAVSLRHLTALRLADVLIRAFGDLYPGLATAGAFVGFSSLAAGCRHPRLGHEVVIQDDLGGGLGAHARGDGLDAVDVYLGNLQMLPAEVVEVQYPVRIAATELVTDSGGPGRFRGGLGIRRLYEFLDDADLVVYTEQSLPEFAPHGVRGGLPGAPARLELERADGSTIELRKARLAVGAGDRLHMKTGGGGGYGPPSERSRAAVLRDIAEDKISIEAARTVYGLEARSISGPPQP
jgi:N-methylhydantoinase B